MNKRGLSSILSVVLIILLVLAAIFIIWMFTRGYVLQQGEITEAKTSLLTGEIEIINYDGGNLTLEKKSGLYKTSKNITEILPNPVDVISVVDRSPSFRDNVPELKSSNVLLFDETLSLKGNKAGLVANDNLYSLTDNKQQLLNIINGWTDIDPPSSNCVCCWIDMASNEFRSNSDNELRIMIIMTDGFYPGASKQSQCDQAESDLTGQIISSIKSAKLNLGNNLRVHSIGFEDDAAINETLLRQMADEGGGEYFEARDAEELISAYTTISTQIKETYEPIRSYDNVIVAFYDDLGNVVTREIPYVNLPIEVFQTKTFDFAEIDDELPGTLIKIEIYAVITTPSGYQVQGPVMDVWEINP